MNKLGSSVMGTLIALVVLGAAAYVVAIGWRKGTGSGF